MRTFYRILLSLCTIWSFAIHGTISTTLNERTQARRFRVLVVSSEGYSHCIEDFGLAKLLADDDQFDVTVLSPGGSCNVLSDRMQQLASPTSALSIIKLELSRDMMNFIAKGFDERGEEGVFIRNVTKKPMEPPLEAKLAVVSDSIRRDNYSLLRQLHENRPFDVAICDMFALGCFEFTDLNKIPALLAGFQLYPTWQDMAHNGMHLLLDRHQRENATASDRYSNRIKSVWTKLNYIYNQFIGLSPITYSAYDVIWNYGNAYRRQNAAQFKTAPAMRNSYPFIDQRVMGTLFEQRYMRPDHVLTGPSWFDLTSRSIEEEKTKSGSKAAKLIEWIEDKTARKSSPIVFMSFGSQARLNIPDTRLVLEALLEQSSESSVQFQAIWTTNTTKTAEILSKDQNLATQAATRLLTVEWAPQLTLLNHSSVRAFVTHGGMSSIMEACATGVPVVCVPIFGDQPYHCQQIEALGNGIRLLKEDLNSPDVLRNAIRRVLTDEKIIKQARLVAEYHASVDTKRRLTEFVQQYARFGYRFNGMSGDVTDEQNSWLQWREYWNVDMWVLVVGVIVFVHMAVLSLITRLL